MFSFGYGPAITEGGDIAWGARGIDDGKSIGFLSDRQTWYLRKKPVTRDESDKDKAALSAFHLLLDGILKKVQDAFSKAKDRGEMGPGGPGGAVVMYEDWIFKATARAADGYVYVTVATKPLPEIPIRRALTEKDKSQPPQTYKAPTDYMVWSSDTRPELGSRVELDGGRGPGVLVSWAHELGHLFMIVVLDKAAEGPSWQDDMFEWRLTNAMGREWTPMNGEEEAA